MFVPTSPALPAARAACGFGLMGLAVGARAASAAGEPSESAGAEAAAFPGQSEARDLPVHARRPIAHRHLRSQAAAERDHGKPLPFKRPLTFAEDSVGNLMKSPWEFQQYGQSGIESANCFRTSPSMPTICAYSVHGGRQRGAWRRYAAAAHRIEHVHAARAWAPGSSTAWDREPESARLTSRSSPACRMAARRTGAPAFFPAAYQGTAVGLGGMPLENMTRADRASEEPRPDAGAAALRAGHDPEDEPRERCALADTIRNSKRGFRAFELAFRMQTEAPEAFDISKESEATKKLYGLDEPETKDFGWQCLMARRLAERNVRFIQINHEYGPGNEVGLGCTQRTDPAAHADSAAGRSAHRRACFRT